MSNLVVLAFEGEYTAQATLKELQKLVDEGKILIEDAVVASASPGGNLDLTQAYSKTGKTAAKGGGIGFIAGLLLGGPIGGLVVGATAGAIAGHMKKQGIDDHFVKETIGGLKPNSSALFLLAAWQGTDDELHQVLKPIQAKIWSTTLDPERAKLLQEMLSARRVLTPGTPFRL